jgi:hypothetical protein
MGTALFAPQIELFAVLIIGAANVFICGKNRNRGHFVRLFAYRGNKLMFFANRIHRLVIL